MKEYKSPICIRLAHLNCPLPLTVESYWACEADCHHCPGRKLNQVWGQEQRVANPEVVRHRLAQGLRNRAPCSPVACALAAKKTLWVGRKADPYQPLELRTHTTHRILTILNNLQWSYVVCSRYTANMEPDTDLFRAGRAHLLIEITPGAEQDWTLFERERTTPVPERLHAAAVWRRQGIHVGVRGEPFIPGYHTTQQFREMLRRLKSHGIRSYNTYNLHLNTYNARRLHAIGLDIERIWRHNQDALWRPIQRELCEIADQENVTLGCPDFVNVPPRWRSRTNTCCGISVPRPFRFNTHHWRRLLQKNCDPQRALDITWEEIGTEADRQAAWTIVCGTSKDSYTMKDAQL